MGTSIPPTDGPTAVRERSSGLMLPLAGRSMPDFGPIFAEYARGLRDEAERVSTLPVV